MALVTATPSDVEFWESRWRDGTTGWDLHAANPAWEALDKLQALPQGRVLVVGAGRGHDAVWFAKRGNAATAVDFAPTAIAAANALATEQGVSIETRCVDLFDLPKSGLAQFDIVAEHTCFCAIEPSRREEYVRVAEAMTKPGGLFIGVFFWQVDVAGPPFATSREEMERLFSKGFVIERLEPDPVSVERRAGREAWAVFRRR